MAKKNIKLYFASAGNRAPITRITAVVTDINHLNLFGHLQPTQYPDLAIGKGPGEILPACNLY